MTATEELRKLLDERGVEYMGRGPNLTYWSNWSVVAQLDGERLWLSHYATPEQAIAATLGSDREAELEALAKDLYENAVEFSFKGWIPYYRDRFAALGIEVEQ